MVPQSFQKIVIQLQKTVSSFFAAEDTKQYWVSCIDISFQNFKIYFLDPFLKKPKTSWNGSNNLQTSFSNIGICQN